MNEYDEARDLMRRLVEVAESDVGPLRAHIEMTQYFGSVTPERMLNAPPWKAYIEWDAGKCGRWEDGATAKDAVCALIAQTPWAGRLL